jgi:hypothetical protein
VFFYYTTLPPRAAGVYSRYWNLKGFEIPEDNRLELAVTALSSQHLKPFRGHH